MAGLHWVRGWEILQSDTDDIESRKVLLGDGNTQLLGLVNRTLTAEVSERLLTILHDST